MPAKLDSIVKGLLKKGHNKNSAYALANFILDKQKDKQKSIKKRKNKKKKGKK